MKERNIRDFYQNQYKEVYGSGCLGWMSKRVHKSLEHSHKESDSFGVVLELGAGHGQHLPFVRHGYDTYLETDINQEILPSRDAQEFPKVGNRVVDAQSLEGIEFHSADRLVATCLLPHLPDPEAALENWRRVVKPGGSLSIYVPSEPGALLRLAQTVTSRRRIEKLGLEYWLAHYREHPYHFPYLRRIVEHVFRNDELRLRGYPLARASWNLSLFWVFEVKVAPQAGTLKSKGSSPTLSCQA